MAKELGSKSVYHCGCQRCWAAKECFALGGRGVFVILGGKRVFFILGGKRVFIIVGGKGVFATGEKEFSSYAAKIRVGKDRESTEL